MRLTHPGSLAGEAVAAVTHNAVFFVAFGLLALLFPDGRLPNPAMAADRLARRRPVRRDLRQHDAVEGSGRQLPRSREPARLPPVELGRIPVSRAR